MAQDITVPDLGDFKNVEVIDVLVKPGDKIDVDTPLITLETEKAAMDVPSTAAGVVKAVVIKKGDRVSKGNVIVQVEGAEAGDKKKEENKPAAAQATPPAQPAPKAEAPAPAAPAPSPAPARQPQAAPGPVAITTDFSQVHASPSIRKFARELGVDLTAVKGSGPKGRVTADDVKAWVKQALKSGTPAAGGALPKVAEVDFAKFGAVEVKPLGRIQKISGPRLQASWLNVPHVWQMDEADITELEETRNKLKADASKAGVKLTPLAFILRACVKALREFPMVNSSLDASGQNLVFKKYVHLGFAADTPNGLVVPVIRDADKKGVVDIAKEMGELAKLARDGKLTPAQMQGGSFTISSLGGIGGIYFTPIINAPEVAIMGVCRSFWKQVSHDGKTSAWRFMLPLSLSWDHRVIDGATAARFNNHFGGLLADMRRIVL